MTKEKIKQSPLKDPDAIRNLESQKYASLDLQDAYESGDLNTYEWFEDNVIQKKAFVVFGKDSGKDSATIVMLNPKTNKEEVVYYTTEEAEVKRLKGVVTGKTIVVEESEEDVETKRDDQY